LPSNLSVRPARYAGEVLVPADLAAVLHVAHRIEETYLGAADMTSAEMLEMVAGPDVRREESLLVLDPQDRPVGAGWYAVDDAGHEVFCESFVDPQRDDARTLLDGLVRHGIDVAHRIIAGREGWKTRAGLLAVETTHDEVLRANGYGAIRRFWRMEVRSDSPEVPATAPALPPGVTIETGGSAEQRQAIYEVDQAAFADHWNFHPRSYEESWKHLLAEPGARPEYWSLLRVDGDPAALCLLSDSRLERGYGYVSVLGVRREYRRRGLAQLLLRRTFVQSRDSGLVGTALHVDSQNPTGATSLYESVGMTAAQVVDVYELSTV
jgi:ribosomal protein S18 acetylase RimI-like enzyme